MPIDYDSVLQSLEQQASRLSNQREDYAAHLTHLRRPFDDAHRFQDRFRAAQGTSHQRLDLTAFGNESPFEQSKFSLNEEPERYVLIAVDGSQVYPDRHKPVFYGLVQAVSISLHYSERSVHISTKRRTQLIFEEELRQQSSAMRAINYQRYCLEMKLLKYACEEATRDKGQVVLLVDGMLLPAAELLDPTNTGGKQMPPPLVDLLKTSQRTHAILCNYVDRPKSTSLAALCAASQPSAHNALRYVPDHVLLRDVLKPAHRTGIMRSHVSLHDGEHLCVCYANFGKGTGNSAVIARLEFPEWCSSAEQMAQLCAILQRHVRLGGGYPFAMSAAHEESVIHNEEVRALDELMQEKLAGDERLAASPKRQAKALGYRGRL